MTADLLSSIAGVILSLLFSYVPGISNWYGALDAIYKRLVMLVLLVLSAAGAFGLSCWGIFDLGISCDQAGALGLVRSLVAATVANQATFLLSPRKAKG